MKCVYCHKELPNGSSFCKYCGHQQNSVGVLSETDVFSVNMGVPLQSPVSSSTYKEDTISEQGTVKVVQEPVFQMDQVPFMMPEPETAAEQHISSGDTGPQTTAVFDPDQAIKDLNSFSADKSIDFKSAESVCQIQQDVKSSNHESETTPFRPIVERSNFETQNPAVSEIAQNSLINENVAPRKQISVTKQKQWISILWRVTVICIELGILVWLWVQLLELLFG